MHKGQRPCTAVATARSSMTAMLGHGRGVRRADHAGCARQARRHRRGRTQLHRSRARGGLCRSAGFLSAWACGAQRLLSRHLQRAIREARCCQAGRRDHGARGRQSDWLHLAERAGVLHHRAHAYHGRYVRRPGLWRQQGLRRLAPRRLPRRASAVLAGGYAEQATPSPRAPIIGLQTQSKAPIRRT